MHATLHGAQAGGQIRALDNCSPPRQQVDDRDYERNDEQKMDQAASYVKTPAQKPENEKNYKNGPKHSFTSAIQEWLVKE